MRHPNPSLATLAALAGAFALAASAVATDAVYKWKDASGQSHYSQSPPPSGTKYQTITPTGGPESSRDVSAATGAPASGSTSQKTGVSRTSDEARALRKKNCETARANLTLLNASPNGYAAPTPATGSANANASGGPQAVARLPREQELARANSQIAQYCGGD